MKVIIMATETTRRVDERASASQDQQAAESRAVLALEGMTCASCTMRIEKGPKKERGVKDASVNFATEQAEVTFDPVLTNVEQMVQKVEAVGYKAMQQVARESAEVTDEVAATMEAPAAAMQKEDEQSRRKQAEIRCKRTLLIVGVVLTLPIVILNMFFMNRFPGENFLLLALTTPVWPLVGWEFQRGAIK